MNLTLTEYNLTIVNFESTFINNLIFSSVSRIICSRFLMRLQELL